MRFNRGVPLTDPNAPDADKDDIAEVVAGKSKDLLFTAIGHFIFEFSQLESTLRHHLAVHLGIKVEHFAAVMSALDFSRLVTIWKVKAEEALARDPNMNGRCSIFSGSANPLTMIVSKSRMGFGWRTYNFAASTTYPDRACRNTTASAIRRIFTNGQSRSRSYEKK